ncbi:hypothetical protein [Lachnoclostridium phytofermentans]|uniref:hypothetical protein n=1 Tax=Lachnoclostridium phytofermentans TaxID=66219 RepID=UPI0009DE93F1|nr:hypothetical protein [Lachnoclostridium phytofermentans]
MKKINIIRFVCIGGMLTAFTVLFQSAPVFLPALGLALSPFSTLPIAIAAVSNILLGFTVYFASVTILTLVSMQESMILLFTTGLLGLMIGALLYRKKILLSTIFSSIALSLGIVVLTYIVSMSAFTDFASSLSIPFTLVIFFSFSLVYSSIWNVCLRKLISYLMKIKMIL